MALRFSPKKVQIYSGYSLLESDRVLLKTCENFGTLMLEIPYFYYPSLKIQNGQSILTFSMASTQA